MKKFVFIGISVVGYVLGVNLGAWLGAIAAAPLFVGAIVNFIGAGGTALMFKSQMKGAPNIKVALTGAAGVILIVVGLTHAHETTPVSISMELIYNFFALLSWPLFIGLNRFWPSTFSDKPNRFDLICHGLMLFLVIARIVTYGDIGFTAKSGIFVATAIGGYALFNISVKLAKGHRPTNVMMNATCGAALLVASLLFEDINFSSPSLQLGIAVWGMANVSIVAALGAAYKEFGAKGQSSLVIPLVYDGILVLSPILMFITGEAQHFSAWTVIVAAGMLAVTVVRYKHHNQTTSPPKT